MLLSQRTPRPVSAQIRSKLVTGKGYLERHNLESEGWQDTVEVQSFGPEIMIEDKTSKFNFRTLQQLLGNQDSSDGCAV